MPVMRRPAASTSSSKAPAKRPASAKRSAVKPPAGKKIGSMGGPADRKRNKHDKDRIPVMVMSGFLQGLLWVIYCHLLVIINL